MTAQSRFHRIWTSTILLVVSLAVFPLQGATTSECPLQATTTTITGTTTWLFVYTTTTETFTASVFTDFTESPKIPETLVPSVVTIYSTTTTTIVLASSGTVTASFSTTVPTTVTESLTILEPPNIWALSALIVMIFVLLGALVSRSRSLNQALDELDHEKRLVHEYRSQPTATPAFPPARGHDPRYLEYIAKLEELRTRGEMSEQTYEKLKREYWSKVSHDNGRTT